MNEDEASFNPDNDSRDYEAVAQSLPVFCVSARAYQKLSGRLQKDTVQVDGFPSVEDTEVPGLQEHTRRLTDTGRAHNSRRFLQELEQLLNSMRLWASSDTGALLSKEKQKADEVFVRAQLASLRKVCKAIPFYRFFLSHSKADGWPSVLLKPSKRASMHSVPT